MAKGTLVCKRSEVRTLHLDNEILKFHLVNLNQLCSARIKSWYITALSNTKPNIPAMYIWFL